MKNKKTYLSIIFILVIGLMPISKLTAQVKMYSEPLTLPSYGVMEPEIMPDWGKYIYPYTMLDRLTNVKSLKTYNGIYLENEYVKALILPEIGGRLHGAQDKTNGYQFLYNQTVIKPALIGLTGAWISGGVEWNFPIGHRQTGFRNTDFNMVVNPDSSKTVWVGETDRITGMRWSVGITVHPGRNWVETKVRLFNCTPYKQRFQYWATSAVRATENYQAVIPGEIMTGHGKHEFYNWPVNNGKNISYWKNTPAASSYFAVDSKSDFFGGYSPEEKAGMVHFADHQIIRGKKLWTWGTAPAGRLWEKLLTDSDLPYFEPQAGAYSDNQPSLFWIQPGEKKIFSHFWFPSRDIGVFNFANLEGSLKLNVNGGKVNLGWSPTGKNKDAVIILAQGNNEFFRKKADTDPAHPFMGETILPANADQYNIAMHVLSSSGDTLLSFSPKKPTNPPLPVALPRPLSPEKVSSQDELYQIGDELNRYNEVSKAKTYYIEALKRDSVDVRCNTAMGIIALKEGLFRQAIENFNKAVKRDETSYEALYYMGLAQQWLGDLSGAAKNLNRASYGQAWYAPSHFNLAQLAAKMHRPKVALEHIERSIRSNGDNTAAFDVKALIQYQLGNIEEAKLLSRKTFETDPLNGFAQALQFFASEKLYPDSLKTKRLKSKIVELTRLDNENHIDLAIRFARCGSYKEASEMLELLTSKEAHSDISPLVYYYQAYYQFKEGNTEKADILCKKASETSSKYCFPNRIEDMQVLEWALRNNPDDAQAHYLLGNLMYKFLRSDEAITHWEKSVSMNASNAVAYRNLGLAYKAQGDLNKAKTAYQAAIKANPSAGRAVVELGLINNEMELPYSDQIEFFEKNKNILSGYNQAATQLIELYVITGRYPDALKLLNSTHFNSWEGKYGIHQLWEQSNIRQGDIEFGKGHFAKALEYYKQSLTYPDNLEVAEQPNTIHARNNYKIGTTLQKMGKKTEAASMFEKVIADNVQTDNAFQYYRGLAFAALNQKEQGMKVFSRMLDELNKENAQAKSKRNNALAIQIYCRSLALEGLGKSKEAAIQRAESVKLYPLVEISAFEPPRSGF